MPYATQDMLDAINATTPDRPDIKRLHYTLGSAFDKFFTIEYLLHPMPPELVEEFHALHKQMLPEILQGLIDAHLQVWRGDAKELDFRDSWESVPSGKGEAL